MFAVARQDSGLPKKHKKNFRLLGGIRTKTLLRTKIFGHCLWLEGKRSSFFSVNSQGLFRKHGNSVRNSDSLSPEIKCFNGDKTSELFLFPKTASTRGNFVWKQCRRNSVEGIFPAVCAGQLVVEGDPGNLPLSQVFALFSK